MSSEAAEVEAERLWAGWYHAARARWRDIEWPFDRFRNHLGGEHPAHPEDLFLGGAAGERVDEAWRELHENWRAPVVRRLESSPRGGMGSEDLWSEAVAKLIGDCEAASPLPDGRCPARIIRYRGRSALGTFIFVTAMRLGTDAHRRRRRHPATVSLDSVGEGEVSAVPESREEVEPEVIEREARRFTEAILSMSGTRRALLALVHGRGMRKGTAGRLLGLPAYQVTRELQRAVMEIRDRLELAAGEPWSRARIDAWLRAWTLAAADVLEDGIDEQEHGHDAI